MAQAFKAVIEDFEADDIRAFYDANVLRVWHLSGKDRTFRIERVQRITKDNMGQIQKRALLRLSDSRGNEVALPLELNPTNRKSIQKLYGNKPKDWVGKLITLFPTTCDSPNGTTDCIRIRPSVPGKQSGRTNRQGAHVIAPQLPEARVNVAEAEFEDARAPGDDSDEPPPGALESDHANVTR